LNVNLYTGLTILVDDLERKMLDISLDFLLVELATDETLDIEAVPLLAHCPNLLQKPMPLTLSSPGCSRIDSSPHHQQDAPHP